MIMSLPSAPPASTKTADQRQLDEIRRTVDIDWAPGAGSRPRSFAMCCERCVYGSGKHREDCTQPKTVRYFDVNDSTFKIAVLPHGYIPAGTAEVIE